MATVKVDLVANVADATKSIAKFSAEASRSLNSINLKTTISAIRDLGAIAANVANSLSNAFAAPIAAASAQEDAVNQLSTALRINGNASRAAIEGLTEYAESIQRTTKFSDDAVLSNLAYLESLTGLSAKGLRQAQTAAIDLAAALGVDLGTATAIVAKAATGNTAALQRYGVVVQKGKTDTETFANALAQLNKQFGGAATAQVKTFSGAMALAENAFGDLLEEIGNLIIKNPTVIGLINQVGMAFQFASNFIKANSAELSQFVTLAVSGLQSLVGIVTQNLDLFRTLGTVIVSAFIVFSSGTLISAIVTTFTVLSTQISAVIGGFSLAKVAALGFKAAIIGIKTAATFGLAFLIDILVNQLVAAIDKGRETFGGLGNFAFATFLQISNGVRSVFIPAILGSVQFIIDKLASVAGIFNQDLANSLKGASERITEALKKNDDQIQQNIKSLNELIAAAAKAKGPAVSAPGGGKQGAGSTKGEKEEKSSGGTAAAVAGGIAAGLQQGGKKGALAVAQSIGQNINNPYVQAALAAAQFLAQGAAQVREQLTSVLGSIDQLVVDIIDGAVEAILVVVEKAPLVVENLINRLPEIIEKIVPRLATAFAMTLSHPSTVVGLIQLFNRVAPIAARTFASEFIKSVPSIVQAFFDEIKRLANPGNAAQTATGVGGIGGLLGFAEGGDIPNIPEFRNDGGLARVSAGESVLSQDTNQALKQFLAGQGGGGGAPQMLTVNLMLGEEQLANAILNLNRQGFRLA